MANRAKKKPPAKAASAEGADDLSILEPDQTIPIAGRSVTVREYGFVEGLKIRPITRPLLDALQKFLDASPGKQFDIDEVVDVLATHHEDVVTLMAISADVEREWVAGLEQEPGMLLMYIWWTVNGPFFMRSAVNRAKANRVVASLGAGQTPTPDSSDTATSPTE